MIVSKFQIWCFACVLAVALFLSAATQIGIMKNMAEQHRTDYLVLSERLDQLQEACIAKSEGE